MTKSTQDPLVETLMQLAASAAPLIRRAREAGVFNSDFAAKAAKAAKPDEEVVEAEVVTPKPASADSAALEAILVRQALRIAELEAEVAALKAKPARKAAAAKKVAARKPAR